MAILWAHVGTIGCIGSGCLRLLPLTLDRFHTVSIICSIGMGLGTFLGTVLHIYIPLTLPLRFGRYPTVAPSIPVTSHGVALSYTKTLSNTAPPPTYSRQPSARDRAVRDLFFESR